MILVRGVETCGIRLLHFDALCNLPPLHADACGFAIGRTRVAMLDGSFMDYTSPEQLRDPQESANPALSLREFMVAQPVAEFGSAALRHILNDRSFFEKEESEEWCALLAKHGYVERVNYDPEVHGEIDFADGGDEVWIFTDAMKRDAEGGEQ